MKIKSYRQSDKKRSEPEQYTRNHSILQQKMSLLWSLFFGYQETLLNEGQPRLVAVEYL